MHILKLCQITIERENEYNKNRIYVHKNKSVESVLIATLFNLLFVHEQQILQSDFTSFKNVEKIIKYFNDKNVNDLSVWLKRWHDEPLKIVIGFKIKKNNKK